jgi:hypothetical protein
LRIRRSAPALEGEDMNKHQWSLVMMAVVSIASSAGCGGDEKASMPSSVTEGAAGASAMPACPETSPGDGATCPMRAQECSYEMLECTCGAAFMGEFGQTTWDCRGMGAGARGCPGAEPMVGSECMPVFGDCEYGERTCDCAETTSSWSCWDPSDCPEAAPENESACEIEGIECEYADAECDCENSVWDCSSGG